MVDKNHFRYHTLTKDLISNDFEHGFGPYSFMPGNNGSAEFEIAQEESGNSYLRWDSRKLGWTFADWESGSIWDETDNSFEAELNPDFSTLYSHETRIESNWWKKYCLSLDIKSFSTDTQMNMTSSYRVGAEIQTRDIMRIYTVSQTCNPTVESQKLTRCIDDHKWTRVSAVIYKPLSSFFVLQFEVFKRSLAGIDNIKFNDCSTIHKQTSTLPPTTNLNSFRKNSIDTTKSTTIFTSRTVPRFTTLSSRIGLPDWLAGLIAGSSVSTTISSSSNTYSASTIPRSSTTSLYSTSTTVSSSETISLNNFVTTTSLEPTESTLRGYWTTIAQTDSHLSSPDDESALDQFRRNLGVFLSPTVIPTNSTFKSILNQTSIANQTFFTTMETMLTEPSDHKMHSKNNSIAPHLQISLDDEESNSMTSTSSKLCYSRLILSILLMLVL